LIVLLVFLTMNKWNRGGPRNFTVAGSTIFYTEFWILAVKTPRYTVIIVLYHMAVSYDTEEDTNDLRSKSKPEPSHHNVEPSVSYPPDPNTSFAKKEVESKGAFAQLNKCGTLRIIDYTETGGSGKILGKKSKR
jgi:hypothetical protein